MILEASGLAIQMDRKGIIGRTWGKFSLTLGKTTCYFLKTPVSVFYTHKEAFSYLMRIHTIFPSYLLPVDMNYIDLFAHNDLFIN